MNKDMRMALAFMKMHGLGNDFVVLDNRAREFPITPNLAKAIGSRQTGIGFDQLAAIYRENDKTRLRFWNADGSVSGACGNATRCIARYLMDEFSTDRIELHTDRGELIAIDAGNGLTSVNMGHPQTEWHEIPLARAIDTLELPIDGSPTATGMGNPHCTFFVENAEEIDLGAFGPAIERNSLFPERTNVQVATVMEKNHMRVRVWERGTGITMASGSSSCAVAVAAVRRGFAGPNVRVELDGGALGVEWRDDGVWMTGPTMHVCSGTITEEFLAGAT